MLKNFVRLFTAGALVSIGLSFFGCGSENVSANNCSVQCEKVQQDCTTKCTDDTCRKSCTTQFDDCSVSCDSVATTSGGGSH